MHFDRCLQMHYFGSIKRAQGCKNISKMPQNQGRGLMLDWTRSQNARRTVGTVACFLPVLAIVLWGPSSAFTIAGISITRASTQHSYYSLRAPLHQSIIIVLSVHTMTSSSSSSSSSECNVEQILDRPCNAADRLLARRLLPRKRLLSFSTLLH